MDIIKKLSRLHMQHQFLPDVVFLATADTPAKMLTAVEDMVELLARAMPDKNAPPSTPGQTSAGATNRSLASRTRL